MRSEAERFGPPAPLRLRDVVRVSEDYEDEELRGLTGVMAGSYRTDAQGAAVDARIEALDEYVIVDIRHLTRTGERLPPPLNREATSTRVSTDGSAPATRPT